MLGGDGPTAGACERVSIVITTTTQPPSKPAQPTQSSQPPTSSTQVSNFAGIHNNPFSRRSKYQAHAAAIGFPALSVSGSGFGQSSRTLLARVSSTACNSAVWISDSSVLCKVGHGVGRQLAVSVSASLQVDSLACHLSI
jgi:hypothetical protein